MIIDKNIIADGVTAEILAKLIQLHRGAAERYARLRDYYAGRHTILNRRRVSPDSPNTKIV